MADLTQLLLIGLITLVLVASFEATIITLLLGVRRTTQPLYPMMGAMGVLTKREAILLGRYLNRLLRGETFRPGSGILGAEERRIKAGLEPEVDS